MKYILGALGFAALAYLGLLALANFDALDDGARYLHAAATYAVAPAQPLDARGAFGFCAQFAELDNAARARFIADFLDARGIAYQRLPIDGSGFDNFFVPFAAAGPFTIFSAHYDKFFDDAAYQGASDNAAAVCMLLVAADELRKIKPARPTALLFTGQEESGLGGATAFYEYATQNNTRVAEVINFDSLGRGGLAARASSERSGLVFTLPLVGEFVYDGRQALKASPYNQPDAALIARLRRVEPITVFDRMTANSDGTFFQANGWNAVNISSDDMYYLERTWHTYADRIELLSQDNLERALKLVIQYARQER